jgi:RNA polymerase sigma-70 factor (ECF subfamily)
VAGLADDTGRWLAEARNGSAKALGHALETCRRYLLLIAKRELDPMLQAKGDASDLVQETFLEAQRDFAQFHGTTDAEFRAWLRRLLLNNVGAFSRSYRGTGKRQVAREVPLQSDDSSAPDLGQQLPADSATPSGFVMEKERKESLQVALARLPDDYRQVILLRYQEERTFEEIGTAMNRTPDAARKLWSRAMDRLRSEWGKPS